MAQLNNIHSAQNLNNQIHPVENSGLAQIQQGVAPEQPRAEAQIHAQNNPQPEAQAIAKRKATQKIQPAKRQKKDTVPEPTAPEAQPIPLKQKRAQKTTAPKRQKIEPQKTKLKTLIESLRETLTPIDNLSQPKKSPARAFRNFEQARMEKIQNIQDIIDGKVQFDGDQYELHTMLQELSISHGELMTEIWRKMLPVVESPDHPLFPFALSVVLRDAKNNVLCLSQITKIFENPSKDLDSLKNQIALVLLKGEHLLTYVKNYNEQLKHVFDYINNILLNQKNHPYYSKIYYLYGQYCFTESVSQNVETKAQNKNARLYKNIFLPHLYSQIKREIIETSIDLNDQNCSQAALLIFRERMIKLHNPWLLCTFEEVFDPQKRAAFEHLITIMSNRPADIESIMNLNIIEHLYNLLDHFLFEGDLKIKINNALETFYLYCKEKYAQTENPSMDLSFFYLETMKSLFKFNQKCEKAPGNEKWMDPPKECLEFFLRDPSVLFEFFALEPYHEYSCRNIAPIISRQAWRQIFEVFHEKKINFDHIISELTAQARYYMISKLSKHAPSDLIFSYIDPLLNILEIMKESHEINEDKFQNVCLNLEAALANKKQNLTEVQRSRFDEIMRSFEKGTDPQREKYIILKLLNKPEDIILDESDDAMIRELKNFDNPDFPESQFAAKITRLKFTDPCDLTGERFNLLSTSVKKAILQKVSHHIDYVQLDYLKELLYLKTMKPDLQIDPEIHKYIQFLYNNIRERNRLTDMIYIDVCNYFLDQANTLTEQGIKNGWFKGLNEHMNVQKDFLKASPEMRIKFALYGLKLHFAQHGNFKTNIEKIAPFLEVFRNYFQDGNFQKFKQHSINLLTLLAPQNAEFLLQLLTIEIQINAAIKLPIFRLYIPMMPWNYLVNYIEQNPVEKFSLKITLLDMHPSFSIKYKEEMYERIMDQGLKLQFKISLIMKTYHLFHETPDRQQILREKLKEIINDDFKFPPDCFDHLKMRPLETFQMITDIIEAKLNLKNKTTFLIIAMCKTSFQMNEQTAHLLECIKKNLDQFQNLNDCIDIFNLWLNNLIPPLYHETMAIILNTTKRFIENNPITVLNLGHFREIAPKQFPLLNSPHQNIAKDFEELVNRINFIDETSPEYYSLEAVVSNDADEFERSEYAKMDLQAAINKVKNRVQRFIKELINAALSLENANEPDTSKHKALLTLSEEESDAQKPWLPAKEHIPNWINLMKHMINALAKMTDHSIFAPNLGILMKAMLVCPTGQDSGFKTAVNSLLLGYNQVGGDFESTVNKVIQDQLNTALISATNCNESRHVLFQHIPTNNASQIPVFGTHRTGMFEYVLSTLYGFPQLTGFKETINRFINYLQIERVLRTFESHFNAELLVDYVLKHFRTNEDSNLLSHYANAEAGDVRSSEAAIKAAHSERPIKIFEGDQALDGYYGWLLKNELNPQEYGVYYFYDEVNDQDTVRIEITRDHIVTVLKKLGFIKADANITFAVPPTAPPQIEPVPEEAPPAVQE